MNHMNDYVKVAQLGEIPVNGSKLVEVEDIRIALFNLDGQIYAIADVCTHDGGPLVEGEILNGHEVKCPRHGARFDIRTGAALSFPAFEPTESYAVRVEGDDVYIASPL
jgi:3-phenylpropionate/trans-cinnamate dioxygenase ferredoxin subunit